jgi:protein-tyrosine phosphatase
MTLAPSPYGTTPDRRRPIEGTYNLREVGGYAASGGRTRWGKLFRSDALHRLTDASRDDFAQLGLGLVIDLRDESELLAAPSRIDGLGIRIVHEPIFTGDSVERVSSTVTLERLYRSIVAEYGENIAAAVGHIARSGDTPVLVHCTAGKDRTGLVIAFALTAVGVDRDEVIADYALTEQNLAGEWVERMILQLTDAGAELTPELEALIGASPSALIAGVIELVERNYGSVAGYLVDNGLTEADLASLTTALVEPVTTTRGTAAPTGQES